jgi:hypothetical protein
VAAPLQPSCSLPSVCCWAISLRHVMSKFTCRNPAQFSTVRACECVSVCVCSPLKAPPSVTFYCSSLYLCWLTWWCRFVLLLYLRFDLLYFTPKVAAYVQRVVSLCCIEIPI